MEKIDYYSKGNWEDRNLNFYQREKISLSFLRELIKDDEKNFLDVGCGEGIFLKYLKKQFPNLNLFGIDNSNFQLKKLSKLDINFKKADLEKKIPLQDETFDIVY